MKSQIRKFLSFKGILILLMLSINVAFAQSQSLPSTDERPTFASTPGQGAAMNTSGKELQKKTTDGAIIIDQSGTVEVLVKNEDGTTGVKTFHKPTVNLKIENKNDDMNRFASELKAWMSHNSECMSYLTEGEQKALGAGNISALYLYEYANAMEKTKTTH